ncbi:MAG: nitrogen fixation protein NifH, partial [Candidatus Methanofastidiosia archaeon]
QNCYMGGVKTLSAFSKIPERNRTREIRKIIEENVEIYLKNQIFKYRLKKNGERTEKPSWKKFGFPLFWQSDTLEVLDVLTSLGVRDERMQDAIDLVVSRQGKDGRWKLERTYNSWIELEKVGEPSKWITLRALRVLKRFYG